MLHLPQVIAFKMYLQSNLMKSKSLLMKINVNNASDSNIIKLELRELYYWQMCLNNFKHDCQTFCSNPTLFG